MGNMASMTTTQPSPNARLTTLRLAVRALSAQLSAPGPQDPAQITRVHNELVAMRREIRAMEIEGALAQRAAKPAPTPAPKLTKPCTRLVMKCIGETCPERGMVVTMDVAGPDLVHWRDSRPGAKSYARKAWPSGAVSKGTNAIGEVSGVFYDDNWTAIEGDVEAFIACVTQGIVETDPLDGVNDEPAAHTRGRIYDRDGKSYTEGGVYYYQGTVPMAPEPANTDPEPEPPKPAAPTQTEIVSVPRPSGDLVPARMRDRILSRWPSVERWAAERDMIAVRPTWHPDSRIGIACGDIAIGPLAMRLGQDGRWVARAPRSVERTVRREVEALPDFNAQGERATTMRVEVLSERLVMDARLEALAGEAEAFFAALVSERGGQGRAA